MKKCLKPAGYFFVCLVVFMGVQAAQAGKRKGHSLARHHGYLLLSLDVGGVAPSIEYSRKNDPRKIKPLKLKGKEKEFLLLPLRQGQYQITRVNAPYFDLPYSISTKDDPQWRFSIKRGKINYVGKLEIHKKRRQKTVYVALLNHIASDLEHISQQYSQLLTQYPMVNGYSVKDAFYEEYTK